MHWGSEASFELAHGQFEVGLEWAYIMGYALCRRPPIIAHCFRIADSWHCCKRILAALVRKPVIWHDWLFHFGVLGNPGPILGHWGA